MAGKRQAKQEGVRSENSKYEFSSFRLSSDEAKSFQAWYSTEAPNVDEMLQILAVDLYRVTVKQDLRNEAVCCSISTQDTPHINAQIGLQSWAENASDAIAIGFFKVYVLYVDQQWPYGKEKSAWG